MSNTPSGPRPPKYVWVTRPKFTLGECRTYFSKDDAIRDFGRPIEKWIDYGNIMEIDQAPVWDPFDVAWTIERVEVRALTRPVTTGNN